MMPPKLWMKRPYIFYNIMPTAFGNCIVSLKCFMKKSFILAFVFLAVAIALLVSASSDFATYSSFSKAEKSGELVKIVGHLAKDQPMYYDPQKDPNYFSFYITDIEQQTREVVLKSAKPQDFELSEQIVVTGKMVNGKFIAKSVLLKCPSKYKDEEIYIRSES